MIHRLFRPLDRYAFVEFLKILVTTALGFPILLVVIDLTDHVDTYLGRHISWHDIALSYVFWIPDSMFMVLPAATLFATVFSIGAFTRHSEVTAAKASGISFYRLVLPIFFGAVLASGLDLWLGAIVPITDAKRNALIHEDVEQMGTTRFNFAIQAEYGRVYKAGSLQTDSGMVRDLQIERKGYGPAYPTYVLAAKTAKYDFKEKTWHLADGELDVVRDTGPNFTVTFQKAADHRLTEKPVDLMARPRPPQELTYGELTRTIQALERSGTDANQLRVERALKIAIPVTCIIIALFGAPLATSTQRGGSAYGIAISLATTMIFLLLIQLSRAIGGKNFIPPDLSAWLPSMLFGAIGLILLARVRT